MNRSAWPTSLELRQQLALEHSAGRSVRRERLHWLGRYGLVEELKQEVDDLRASPHWDASLALEVSRAWLLAGHLHEADLAFLEADRQDPSLVLVPDVWGLWPAPADPIAPTPEEDRAAVKELATQIRRWRQLDPMALEPTWRHQVQAEWTAALSSTGLDELVLLLRHRDVLEQPIEEFLAELVGERAIEDSPGQAQQFWAVVTDIRPDWSHARIKAADLALARGDLDRCDSWITTATEETRCNPWYWDIAARLAVETGAIATALDHWSRALAAAPPDLAELFRQRRRDARRGAGVLQARTLLERGDAPTALALLQRLVADDPEWPPLRSLLQQAEAGGASEPGMEVRSGAEPAPLRFARFLDRAASRIAIPLTPASAAPENADPGLESSRQMLQRFSRTLSAAEARFALDG